MQNSAGQIGSPDETLKNKFLTAINDDLNMPRAMAVVQEMLKSPLDDADKFSMIKDYDQVLGLGLDQVAESEALPPEVQQLTEERQAARAAKDWARSDQLRDKIQQMGYVVQDTKEGVKVIKN